MTAPRRSSTRCSAPASRARRRERAASAIAAINEAGDRGAVVVACDVPSGVDASTGEVAGGAARAARHRARSTRPSPACGSLPARPTPGGRVIDIGIPRGGAGRRAGRADRGSRDRRDPAARQRLDEVQRPATCSSAAGRSGSRGARACPRESAMRAGAGYVTACVPASLNLIFETRLLEVMTRAAARRRGRARFDARADTGARGASSAPARWSLGPGLGRRRGRRSSSPGRSRRRRRCRCCSTPTGSTRTPAASSSLAGRPAATVLTPHAGELARLLESDSAAVEARRLRQRPRRGRRARGAVVVLKGDDTLVADAGRPRSAVNRGGAPALATAGTGDVLSGVIGALPAQGARRRSRPPAPACSARPCRAAAARAGRRRGRHRRRRDRGAAARAARREEAP